MAAKNGKYISQLIVVKMFTQLIENTKNKRKKLGMASVTRYGSFFNFGKFFILMDKIYFLNGQILNKYSGQLVILVGMAHLVSLRFNLSLRLFPPG